MPPGPDARAATDRSPSVGIEAGAGADPAGPLCRLLPAFVASVARPLAGCPLSAWPEERAMARGAVPRRRRELLAGRWCAHAALALIGEDDRPVGRAEDRRPDWPPGVVGSITHGGDWCAAAVAPSPPARGLGIDVEPLWPALPGEAADLLLTAGERAAVARAAGAEGAAIAFSAKESVYKCLSPLTGWRLDPAEVTIELRPRDRTFLATLTRHPLGPLKGRYSVFGGHVFTAVCLRETRALSGPCMPG